MNNNSHILYYHKEIDELAKARQQFIERFPKLAPFLSNTSKDPVPVKSRYIKISYTCLLNLFFI